LFIAQFEHTIGTASAREPQVELLHVPAEALLPAVTTTGFPTAGRLKERFESTYDDCRGRIRALTI
jgi:hypothetical protein